MRAGKFGQSLPLTLQITIAIVCLGLPALAQQPAPTPPPAIVNPASQPSAGGNTLSELFARLSIRAAELIPALQNEIEKPMLGWFENLSYALAAIIILFSFARLWRENSGAGADVFWWFGRLAVVFALMGSGPLLIDKLNGIGQEIASGGDGDSVLARFYVQQRNSFDVSYVRFAEGNFTVKSTGENIPPPPGGGEAVIGVLYDVASSPKDVDRKLQTLSRDMPTLFMFLSFARGIIDFGDFYLLLLGNFLLIVVRLAAPVMIALAVDRNLAHKISYQFLWGVVVLTLIWPAVSQLIRAFAYMGGNLAMALGDSNPLYKWDPQTMQEIGNSLHQPFYTVILAAAIMTVAGLSLWASPFIAYKVSTGQVYESISSTVSGWMGALVSAGVEFYSSSMASAINNQAERTQAQGQYNAEVARAGAGLEAGDHNVRANQIRGLTSAHGSRVAALAGIEGARAQQVMGFGVEKDFGLRSIEAQAALAKNDIWTRKDLAVADQQAASKREGATIETDRAADTQHFIGGKIIKGSEWLGGAARTALADKDGRQTLAGRGAGSLIEIGGGAYGLYQQYDSIQSRAAGKQGALAEYTDQSIRNQGAAGGRLDGNQDLYRESMKGATIERASGYIAAADAGAAISAGGANRNYAITAGGINRGAALDLQANRINYAGSISAAGITRDASFEAARLRALSAVVGAVGHSLAREAGQGMTLRY